MDAPPLTTGEPVTPAHTAEEIASQVVAAAVWAPSVHNTQPWRFSAHGEQISLLADGSRRLMVADPGGREMMISCGAALFTARLALRVLGYIPEFRLFPDPGDPMLVAELSWRRRAAPAEWEHRLFRQVPQRRTHRGGFDPLPLPPGLLAILRAGAQRDGALLRVVADDGRRAALATLVETAERAQRLDRDYVRELADWVPPPWSATARRGAAYLLSGPRRAYLPVLPRPRLRPWSRVGSGRVQRGTRTAIGRGRVPADDRGGRPAGLGAGRPGIATSAAHLRHLRRGGGPAQPAA